MRTFGHASIWRRSRAHPWKGAHAETSRCRDAKPLRPVCGLDWLSGIWSLEDRTATDSQEQMPEQLDLEFRALVAAPGREPRSAEPDHPPDSGLNGTLRETLGPRLGPVLSQLFDRMEIAEQEIKRAQAHHPRLRDRFHRACRQLQPPPVLEGLSDQLYRAHAREI